MSVSQAFAERLASGVDIDEPVAVVVAHPDDETLWTGAALRRLKQLRLILLTDGAPLDMADAVRHGFKSRAAYANARASEFGTALTALDVRAGYQHYDVPDQQTAATLAPIIDQLAADLADAAAVITHPYEGGHPDHDAAAYTVRAAVDRLARAGSAPAVVEFACYHAIDGQRRFGEFWPDPGSPEQTRVLDAKDHERVGAAILAHHTQAMVIGGWRPQVERWRAAPAYDFTASPPPGWCLYDSLGWAMNSARWRALAQDQTRAERARVVPVTQAAPAVQRA